MTHFRRYFIAGILFLVPIWATFLLLRFLIDVMDKTLLLLPKAYQPDQLLGFHFPGLGLLFSLLLVLLTGILITNVLGRWLLRLWEAVVARIPLVRAIYTAIKQVLQTVLTTGGQSFRRVVLVEYPRRDIWSIAFQTSDNFALGKETTGKELITVFVPTTPNPTSGFILLVPKEDTHDLPISVDEALKMVISLGVVSPQQKNSAMVKAPVGD